MIPLPLVYGVYLGTAEAAREVALTLARKRLDDPGIQGARFHRPQERTHLRFSGRLALGLGLDE